MCSNRYESETQDELTGIQIILGVIVTECLLGLFVTLIPIDPLQQFFVFGVFGGLVGILIMELWTRKLPRQKAV